MISSVTSYDEEELLNSAYANIVLLADKCWAFYQEEEEEAEEEEEEKEEKNKDKVKFRYLNHKLWVQYCKLREIYREEGNTEKKNKNKDDNVSCDKIIPYSDNTCENVKKKKFHQSYDKELFKKKNDIVEPWMIKKVEELFTRLNSDKLYKLNEDYDTLSIIFNREIIPSRKVLGNNEENFYNPHSLRNRFQFLVNDNDEDEEQIWKYRREEYPITQGFFQNDHLTRQDYEKYKPWRYKIENKSEMDLHAIINSDSIKNLWKIKIVKLPTKVDEKNYLLSGNVSKNSKIFPRSKYRYNKNFNQYIERRKDYHKKSNTEYKNNYFGKPFSIRPSAILSPEVPEFFPKETGATIRSIDRQQQQKQQQQRQKDLIYFPSSLEMTTNYKDELFPYKMGGTVAPVIGMNQNYNQKINAAFPTIVKQSSKTTNWNESIRSGTTNEWINRRADLDHRGLKIQLPINQCQIELRDKIFFNENLKRGSQISCEVSTPMMKTTNREFDVVDGIRRRRIITDEEFSRNIEKEEEEEKEIDIDYKNVILLKKSSTKFKRNNNNDNDIENDESLPLKIVKKKKEYENIILESSYEQNLNSERDVLIWLENCYPKRGKDFHQIDELTKEFIIIKNKSNEEFETLNLNIEKDSNNHDKKIKKRLYRDVLTNTSNNSTSCLIKENLFDKRYEELEIQAIEQYRTSEESLALRYQELERQAMEQYRNTGESSSNLCESLNFQRNLKLNDKTGDTDKKKEGGKCIDEKNCSGFGNCAAVNESINETTKGKNRNDDGVIKILKGKKFPIQYHLHNEDKREDYSKNLVKGASGDKIEITVNASPNRRMIPMMSPYNDKRIKSETERRLNNKFNIGENQFHLKTINGKLMYSSYEDAEGESIETRGGGGDERMKILDFPSGSKEILNIKRANKMDFA